MAGRPPRRAAPARAAPAPAADAGRAVAGRAATVAGRAAAVAGRAAAVADTACDSGAVLAGRALCGRAWALAGLLVPSPAAAALGEAAPPAFLAAAFLVARSAPGVPSGRPLAMRSSTWVCHAWMVQRQ